MTKKRAGIAAVAATVLLGAGGLVADRLTSPSSTLTAAATYYVSTSGSDSASGTSPSSPWRTIAKANAAVQPGTSVVLTGNFVKEVIAPARSGTATDPINYSAPAGASLDQPGLVGTIPYVAYMGARSYVTVAGITFDNSNYVNAPVTNKGVVLRSSNHITFTGCTFNHMQVQLIGSDDNQIVGSTFREFIASYVNPATGQPDPNHPVSAGDMLNVVLGSDRNVIQFNDMRYGGHSLIQVGNGTGNSEQNAANVIADNTLSNPWYKPIIVSDDGAGTVVERNLIEDATSVPTLWSTIVPGTKEDASAGLQVSGENFVIRNNTFTNNVADYGVLSLGSRYYNTTLIESKNNQVYGNTFTGNFGAASVSFILFQSAADKNAGRAVPSLTGNDVHDNVFHGNAGTPNSWNGSTLYTTLMMHAASYAPPWPAGGYGGNTVASNAFDAATNANLTDVLNNGQTIHVVQSLAQLEAASSADVHGNTVWAPPPPPPPPPPTTTTAATTTVSTTTAPATTTAPTTTTTPSNGLQVSITSQTSTTLTLSWKPAVGAAGYEFKAGPAISVSPCDSATRVSNTWNAAQSSTKFKKLVGSNVYCVVAVNEGVAGAVSYP